MALCCLFKLCLTLWHPVVWISQGPLSSTVSQSLLKFIFIESVMLSNHFFLCYPPLLLPSILPSIRDFSSESILCIRWPRDWTFSILPMNIQGWFSLGLTNLISLKSKGFSRVFSSTMIRKHQFFGAQPFLFFFPAFFILSAFSEKSGQYHWKTN